MLLRRSRLVNELEKIAFKLIPSAALTGRAGTALGKLTRRHGGKMLIGGLAVPAVAIEGKDALQRASAGLSEENYYARMAGLAPAGAPKRPRV